jgi:hypothetical protein
LKIATGLECVVTGRAQMKMLSETHSSDTVTLLYVKSIRHGDVTILYNMCDAIGRQNQQ